MSNGFVLFLMKAPNMYSGEVAVAPSLAITLSAQQTPSHPNVSLRAVTH